MHTPNAIDTEQIKESIDLRELASRYVELRRASGEKELCGPCPKCGGDDRFHVTRENFFCREGNDHCGHKGDAIEFVMWLDSVDFKEACSRLANGTLPSLIVPVVRSHKAKAVPSEDWRSPEWQRKARREVQQAHERLLDKAGTAGQEYLQRRGLEPHTWVKFNLGLTLASLPGTDGKERAPAITMPWFASGELRGIRYRFLEVHNGRKQTAYYGSSFAGALFGGQALMGCAESSRWLLICEGELNAMSAWQVAHETHLDVLSLGSESAKLSPRAIEYAAQFRRVLVWADREEIAQQLMDTVPGAYGIQSPEGKDANDLLQAGRLGGFLALVRKRASRSAHELEALHWALYDAAQLPGGIDASTAAVLQQLSPKEKAAA